MAYISYIYHFDIENANIRQKPGRDTGYMVHPPGGILEVGKASQHQLWIGFSLFVVRSRCKVFDSNFSLSAFVLTNMQNLYFLFFPFASVAPN
jgi:hypothetical protein